jgi:hypothetical protein
VQQKWHEIPVGQGIADTRQFIPAFKMVIARFQRCVRGRIARNQGSVVLNIAMTQR